MPEIDIAPLAPEDDSAALALEGRCVQGTSLRIRFRRPTFHARSDLYGTTVLLRARRGGEIVGVAAGALKTVRLHGAPARALYTYDLRVHPDHRDAGIGRRLGEAVIAGLGADADCIYTLVNGQNTKALDLVRHGFAPRVEIPLTYVLIPVLGSEASGGGGWEFARSADIRAERLRRDPGLEMVPDYEEERMTGFVAGLALAPLGPGAAGGSLWSNERILAEQIVAVPAKYHALRLLGNLTRAFADLPHIPHPGETVRSWYLFDLYADGSEALGQVLAAAREFARKRERTYLYALLQDGDPLLDALRRMRMRMFTLPYRLLAKGRAVPRPDDRIYIDVRDL